jgi:hypothetical protein
MLNQAVNAAKNIPGWMSEAELQWLSDTANQGKPITWCEIGTMVGRSWLCVAMSLPPGSTLVNIDVHLGEYHQNKDTWKKAPWVWDDNDYTWQATLAKLKRNDITIVQVKSDAIKLAQSAWFKANQFDVVFIDACHTYEGTKKQIELYRGDHLICGHDYNKVSWPGVVQAVDEMLPNKSTVPNTSIWYHV